MGPAQREPNLTVYSGRFAKKVRKLREAAGFTTDDMVLRIAKFNESERKPPKISAYYGWEQGTGAPHFDLLPPLAKALKATIHDLFPKK